MDQAGQYHTGISKGTHHKGPRQAGNKSLIGFRAGHGICGYNGFIPSSEAIPIPAKEGPSSRAGPTANKDRGQPGWEFPQSSNSLSTYQASISNGAIAKRRPATAPIFSPPRGPTSPPDEDVVAESQDDLGLALPPAKFLGTSTYSTGYIHPLDNARIRKDELMPPPKGALRKRPAFMAGSTYSGTFENSVEINNGQGWMEEKHSKLLGAQPKKFGTKWREVVYQRQAPNSFYQTDFGIYGDGMAAQLPKDPLGFSKAASTADLFHGSNKAFGRLPGYTGFLPETYANARAVSQAKDHTSADQKNCRLFTLHQLRNFMPGTAIFEPRDAANLMEGPKGRAGTSSAFNNAYMSSSENLALLAHNRSLEKYYGSKNGTASFFQPGSPRRS